MSVVFFELCTEEGIMIRLALKSVRHLSLVSTLLTFVETSILPAIVFAAPDGTQFEPAGSYHTGSGAATAASAMGDFDGDSCVDAAVAQGNYDITIFKNDCSGKFVRGDSASGRTVSSSYTASLASYDINKDGKDDLIGTSEGDDKLFVLLAVGEGRFAAPVTTSVGVPWTRILEADFNNDDTPDLALIGDKIFLAEGLASPTPQSGYFRVVKEVDSSPLALGSSNHSRRTESILVSDLDNNGVDELLVVNGTDYNKLAIISFQSNYSYQIHSVSLARKMWRLGKGRFNSDDREDLILTGEGAGMMLLNNSSYNDFRFTTKDLPGVSQMWARSNIATADVNRDGIDDVAVWVERGLGNGPVVIALLGPSGESVQLVEAVICDNSLQPNGEHCNSSDFGMTVTLKDMDQDGYPDVQAVAFEDDLRDQRLLTARQIVPGCSANETLMQQVAELREENESLHTEIENLNRGINFIRRGYEKVIAAQRATIEKLRAQCAP